MNIRVLAAVFLLAIASSCKKDSGSGGTTPPPPSPPPPVVETAPLKSVATFPIAVATGYGTFINNATSSAILKRDFSGMTFENEMKNSSLVNSSGQYNFNTADAMVASAQAAGIKIHGHVLAWHSQAQGAYYRSLLDAGGSAASNYAKVDSLLKTTIQTIAGHFKGKVRGWDVINEMFADGPAGAIRNNNNTANATSDNLFVWSHYLGRDFGVKAFTYAAEADPDAKLFINDYNLEFSTAKLDSLIAYVAEIRNRGARVDGIGTQMHVNITTNKDAIDNHFKKLAATGLLVHMSELDIGVNTTNSTSLSFTSALETTQAEMYNYIITSYMRNVPKAQRYGVTIWGLLDNQSWRYKNGADYPLIYDANGGKKKAYEGVLNALKSGL